MTRALLIGPEQEALAAGIVKYAEAHPYVMGGVPFVPGNHPEYVGHFNDYRTVFSYTHANGQVFRHLSVSVPGRHYPNPIAVWMLAGLFGFTGWDGKSDLPPKDWAAGPHPDERCVVVVQKVVTQ